MLWAGMKLVSRYSDPSAMRLNLDEASHRIVAGSIQSAAPAACRFTTASYCLDVDQAEAVESTARSRSYRPSTPCFELTVSRSEQKRPDVRYLLSKRPIALLSLVPRPAVLFTAGAVSGAIGKTLTAPLDRVKLLLQTSGGLQKGAVKQAVRQGGVWQALVAIGRTEGIKGYWKGNLPQILRVVPYSATQLYSYEVLKKRFKNEMGELSLSARLAAGGLAGMTATLVTYPLDTLRLRIAVDPSMRSIRGASAALFREGSYNAFFRGLTASLIGIAPYMALELATYDLMPSEVPGFAKGFTAALFATSLCYPLDTVRRQIQLQSAGALGARQAFHNIIQRDGVPGLYKGFLPNALKNLPNKGIKLATFDTAKDMLGRANHAYDDELVKWQRALSIKHSSSGLT
ncbi:hypothetical protein ABBQ32_005745 [Trebouxia sp. C0010 RCD-2024]